MRQRSHRKGSRDKLDNCNKYLSFLQPLRLLPLVLLSRKQAFKYIRSTLFLQSPPPCALGGQKCDYRTGPVSGLALFLFNQWNSIWVEMMVIKFASSGSDISSSKGAADDKWCWKDITESVVIHQCSWTSHPHPPAPLYPLIPQKQSIMCRVSAVLHFKLGMYWYHLENEQSGSSCISVLSPTPTGNCTS